MAKKSYTREFKLKVVQAIESAELRPAQACREYQIAESVLNRWRHEVRLRGAEEAFTPLTSPTAAPEYETRIAELERVCGQLAVENAALKRPCSGSSPSPAPTPEQPAAGVPQPVHASALHTAGPEPVVGLRAAASTYTLRA
jgi:transposase